MNDSCESVALKTLNRMFEDNTTSNLWLSDKNIKCFYVIGKATVDGAVGGTIWKYINESQAIKYSTFRINADGIVKRFPLANREMRSKARF